MMPDPTAVFGPAASEGRRIRVSIHSRYLTHAACAYSHRIAKLPPVINPAIIAFQLSSFCLMPLIAQS